jgi:hypothetical protein
MSWQTLMASVEEAALAEYRQVSTATCDAALGLIDPARRKAVAAPLVDAWPRTASRGQAPGGLEYAHVQAHLGLVIDCDLLSGSCSARRAGIRLPLPQRPIVHHTTRFYGSGNPLSANVNYRMLPVGLDTRSGHVQLAGVGSADND